MKTIALTSNLKGNIYKIILVSNLLINFCPLWIIKMPEPIKLLKVSNTLT